MTGTTMTALRNKIKYIKNRKDQLIKEFHIVSTEFEQHNKEFGLWMYGLTASAVINVVLFLYMLVALPVIIMNVVFPWIIVGALCAVGQSLSLKRMKACLPVMEDITIRMTQLREFSENARNKEENR